jgi:hypothetical protein
MRKYLKVPHNLDGKYFILVTFRHRGKGTLVSGSFAHLTQVQVFIIASIQYAIIATNMNLMPYKSHWENHLQVPFLI